ncbi:hypothetical protein NBRC116583_02600 [Arenicella sp. 4NH20-0111]|uniref:hypothetical protein n=1 Tax=Arenicella sp. 4NH20-0111 TaxID=3127648 RepID=UPI003109B181
MDTLENRLKTTAFWLKLGVINHLVTFAVIAMGCVYSGFTCRGELMKDALSVYAFTLFTPQLALEVILILALFLVCSSLRDLRENTKHLMWFLGTLVLLVLFMYWQ